MKRSRYLQIVRISEVLSLKVALASLLFDFTISSQGPRQRWMLSEGIAYPLFMKICLCVLVENIQDIFGPFTLIILPGALNFTI